jgi:signal transduction histidine kinase
VRKRAHENASLFHRARDVGRGTRNAQPEKIRVGAREGESHGGEFFRQARALGDDARHVSLDRRVKRTEGAGELLALLAHDLKNPLAAVLTNLGFIAGVLRDVEGDASLVDAREAVVDARLACESMQRFCGNLELLAREATGRVSLAPLDPTPLDLVGLVDEIVGRQTEAAQGRRLHFVVRAPQRTYARADRELVSRATDNLLADAVQHAPSGTEITIDVGARDAEAQIVVRDSGPIVPAAMRAQAATPIGQSLAKGRPELRYGRGLALHAASLAVIAAGGALEIGEADGRSALALVVPLHRESP